MMKRTLGMPVIAAAIACLSLSASVLSAPGPEKPKLDSVLRGPYLGQTPPGEEPALFAPGIVSTGKNEFSCTFSADGKEFYFARDVGGHKYNIFFSEEDEAGWAMPQVAPFSGEFLDHEPHISPDGKRLFWGSMRPLPDGKLAYSTWVLERDGEAWGEPHPLGFFAMYVTSTRGGTLYYTARGDGGASVARSRFADGRYGTQEILAPPVLSEFWDGHPFIAPDESYLIFDSEDRPGSDECGLFISFRKGDGGWTEPKNMKGRIGTERRAAYAMLSHDGEYLFFSAGGDIYWVDSKIIEEFRPKTPISRIERREPE